jgi:hypothetical protein
MHPATATIAAAGLLVAGGAAGAGLVARPEGAGAPVHPVRPAPVEVRTQIVHRTVHVVRHIRRKPRVTAPPPAPAAVAAPPQRAAVTVAPAAPPAPRVSRPLRTHSSSTGGGGEDRGEREGGGDD